MGLISNLEELDLKLLVLYEAFVIYKILFSRSETILQCLQRQSVKLVIFAIHSTYREEDSCVES